VHAGAQRVYFSLQRGDFGAQGDRLLFAGGHFRPQRQQFLFQRQKQRGGGGVIVMMVVVVMVMMLWTTYKRTSRQQSKMRRGPTTSSQRPTQRPLQHTHTYLAHCSLLSSPSLWELFFCPGKDI
jgi:hypothetical protein